MDWFWVWHNLQAIDINHHAMNPCVVHVPIAQLRSPRDEGSDSLIMWLARMHALGLSPVQITSHYKQKVREL